MKSTAAKVTRATRPTLVTATPTGPRATPQDPAVVGVRPDYEVRAEQAVQLATIERGDGTPYQHWMTWAATVEYRYEFEGEQLVPCNSVRLSAEYTDYEATPSRKETADITRTIGILSIEEFRAVVAGLNALAATLPSESPFARAAAIELGE